MTKICDSCSFELELTNFRTRKYRNGGSGILNICRACERRKNMEYYERNKEGMKAQATEYYWLNREKTLQSVRKYREDNRETIKAKGREYYRKNLVNRLLNGTKARARKWGFEHDITAEDIIIPEVCPLLNIPLQISDKRTSSGSPSVDRIDSSKGYIKGNVWVISHKANTIKSDATLQELQELTKNLGEFLN